MSDIRKPSGHSSVVEQDEPKSEVEFFFFSHSFLISREITLNHILSISENTNLFRRRRYDLRKWEICVDVLMDCIMHSHAKSKTSGTGEICY